MFDWYDRKGQRISIMEAASLFEIPGYKRVALTVFEDGRRLSTVWLGLSFSYHEGPPLIFESMLFDDNGALDQWRYSTELEALAGHEAIVAQLRPAVTLKQLITGG